MNIAIKEFSSCVEGSALARYRLAYIRSIIEKPIQDAEGGFRGHRYSTLESMSETIHKAAAKAGAIIEYEVSFTNDLTNQCTLHITVYVIESEVLHIYKKEHVSSTRTFKNEEDGNSKKFITDDQRYGAYQTYMTRYMLRSYFTEMFDGAQDPDLKENYERNRENHAKLKRENTNNDDINEPIYSDNSNSFSASSISTPKVTSTTKKKDSELKKNIELVKAKKINLYDAIGHLPIFTEKLDKIIADTISSGKYKVGAGYSGGLTEKLPILRFADKSGMLKDLYEELLSEAEK